VKGGGQPFAALTVGSRAVGKRKTLDAISPCVRAIDDDERCGAEVYSCILRPVHDPSASSHEVTPIDR
jgi:hypothetical protein